MVESGICTNRIRFRNVSYLKIARRIFTTFTGYKSKCTKMKVFKFGGASVNGMERIKNAARNLSNHIRNEKACYCYICHGQNNKCP